jgi:hypothetical protein
VPRGDGTGPAGMGPMTGRAVGFCAGYAAPGFVSRGVFGPRGVGARPGRAGYPYGSPTVGRRFSRPVAVGGFVRFGGFGRGRGRGFGRGRGRR